MFCIIRQHTWDKTVLYVVRQQSSVKLTLCFVLSGSIHQSSSYCVLQLQVAYISQINHMLYMRRENTSDNPVFHISGQNPSNKLMLSFILSGNSCNQVSTTVYVYHSSQHCVLYCQVEYSRQISTVFYIVRQNTADKLTLCSILSGRIQQTRQHSRLRLPFKLALCSILSGRIQQTSQHCILYCQVAYSRHVSTVFYIVRQHTADTLALCSILSVALCSILSGSIQQASQHCVLYCQVACSRQVSTVFYIVR